MKTAAVGAAAQITVGMAANEASAAPTLNVAVIGGGMAGTTAAKYLRYWAGKLNLGSSVTVTIFEPNASYISNIKSNEVLVGLTTLSALTYKYDTIKSKYGVRVTNTQVNSINRDTGDIFTSFDKTGTPLGRFDVIILATGLQFDYSAIERVNSTGGSLDLNLAIPHAWQAGPQTTALQSQLRNLTNGNKVVIAIPASPYRCPPGPYERACVIADWLKKNKPASKVVVLDANADKQAEKPVFDYAFNTVHAGYIEYIPNTKVTKVDVPVGKNKVVYVSTLENGVWVAKPSIYAEVVNVIPPMKAPPLVLSTLGALPNGLDASGRWAQISEQTYRSIASPKIYVIGDGIFSKQPKAGHIGNQEAKICADAILRAFMNVAPYPTPVTNSACFTPITTKAGYTGVATASWLTALYRYDPTLSPPTVVHIAGFAGAAPGPVWPVSGKPSTGLYSDMNKWFTTLMQDTFA